MKIFYNMSPGFYKNLLFSEVNKKIPILVVYTTGYDASSRNKDFMQGDRSFPFIQLSGGKLKQIWDSIQILRKNEYQELIVGGYSSFFDWCVVMFSPKRKNSVMVESSIHETKKKGIRAFLKKIFFRRVSKAYVSGSPHKKLVEFFDFKGITYITGGVGVFNRIPQPPYQKRNHVKNFLFVGRLIAVKNVGWLIDMFTKHPELDLTIAGFGVQDEYLRKKITTKNIHMVGAVDNKKLPLYYQQADVFILPSISEPWGLVVEEALNNGTPVMASNMIGAADDLVIPYKTGMIFQLHDEKDFESKLSEIVKIDVYNEMRKFISTMDFKKRESAQIDCYIH